MKVYIRNKIVSFGGNSTVKDAEGKDLYQVKGKVFSPTRVKYVCDMEGNRLYKVRNKVINFLHHACFVKNAADNKVVVKVKNKLFRPGYSIVCQNGDEMSVNGKWFSLSSTIMKNGVPVGTIRRKFGNAADVLFRDAFELEANEADMPFMIALVIAIDNIVDKMRSEH